MPFKINTRVVGSVAVLDCSGRITLGEGSVMLRDAVRNCIWKKKQTNLVLNLADVAYIDDSGIGELVDAFTTVRQVGGALKLLNLTEKISDVLQITKLYGVFEKFDNEADALKSFGVQVS